MPTQEKKTTARPLKTQIETLQRKNRKLTRENKELRAIARLQSQLVCHLELEKLNIKSSNTFQTGQ